jgi:hypothetical protein
LFEKRAHGTAPRIEARFKHRSMNMAAAQIRAPAFRIPFETHEDAEQSGPLRSNAEF